MKQLKKKPKINTKSLIKTLENLRKDIIQTQENNRLSTQPVELDQQRIGRLSRIDALQIQEVAKNAELRRETELRKVEAAIKRLKKGEYGWCTICGDQVEEGRLLLDPAIPTCLICARNS